MRYQVFGNTGLKVSEFCLGAMTFGNEWGWGADASESRSVFDAFAEAGGNFIDTADVYTGGTSERLVGEFIAGERDRWVVGTKFTAGPGASDPNAAGNSRKNMKRCLEASLERLGTDYVDVYWVHVWDFLTPVEEVMRAFDDLVREGKVLYVGLSDAPAWVMARAATLAEQQGSTRLAAMQVLYNLNERSVEGEFLSLADSVDLAVCAWSPLDQGWLSGKFTGGSAAGNDSRRRAEPPRAGGDARAETLSALEAVAVELDSSPAAVALRWLRQRNPRVIPIVGARTESQIRDNLSAAELVLPEAAFERLEATSRSSLPWPFELYSTPAQTGFTYGGFLDRIDSARPFPIRRGATGGLESYVHDED